MGQITIGNFDDAVVVKLKQRAEHDGLSLEEAARRVLVEALQPSKAEQRAEMDRIAAMGPPITKPPFAEDLIREDRDGGEDGRYRR